MGRREWYRSIAKGEKQAPTGCISGMLQLFDFHHILYAPRGGGGGGRGGEQGSSPPLPQHYSSQPKGVEAPRNSLELDEAAAATTAKLTASTLAEEFYGIPIGIEVNAAPSLRKKSKKDLLVLEEEEEEKRSSQCETPRTPNVVARLMGLEILPEGASTPTAGFKSLDHNSPKISTKKKMASDERKDRRQPLQKRDTNLLPNVRVEVGTRSLPDTPRASSERPREDPRLSLQLNKENINRASSGCEVSNSLPPSPVSSNHMSRQRRRESSFKAQDENRSPRSHHHAREILKQVKESINIRKESYNPFHGHLTGSTKTSAGDKKASADQNERASKHSAALKPSPSASPPTHYHPLDPLKHKAPPKPPRDIRVRENVEAKQIVEMEATKCKKASCERFTKRIKMHPPPSETATQSYSLKTQLLSLPPPKKSSTSMSQDACDKIKSTSYAVPKHSHRPPSPERSTHQVSHEHQQLTFQHRIYTKEQDPEFLYVRWILERAGILSTERAVKWYSPSLPVDPFIFHQLELDLPFIYPLREADNKRNKLAHRCNRKLLFHLVEDILSDLLCRSTPPFTKLTHKKRLQDINKELLLDRLWSRIKSFPQADCQVIDDIDALVAEDLGDAKVRRLLGHPMVAAEAEGVALEIEGDVLDSVIGEAAATLALCSRL